MNLSMATGRASNTSNYTQFYVSYKSGATSMVMLS